MDPMILVVIIICAIVLAIGIWAVVTVNNFKRLEVECEQYKSGIQVALEKRYDVLTKMLDVTKSYMGHESDLMSSLTKIRSDGVSVSRLEDINAQMDKFQTMLFARAEAYPELRSSEVFQRLQVAIDDVEGSLQAARRIYNNAVSMYNKSIVVFPASLLAGNRSPLKFFEVTDQVKTQDVKMDFS